LEEFGNDHDETSIAHTYMILERGCNQTTFFYCVDSKLRIVVQRFEQVKIKQQKNQQQKSGQHDGVPRKVVCEIGGITSP